MSGEGQGANVLSHKMPNGASVSDWLGTSMTAAQLATSEIQRVRRGEAFDVPQALKSCEAYLAQALIELWTVQTEISR